MRKLLLAVVLFTLSFVGAASAQDHSADVDQAIAQLHLKNVDTSGPCGAARITNLVVWNLGERYGLLGKAGGTRAALKADGTCIPGDQTRDPGVATDYVIDSTTYYGFDILQDAGTGNNPRWAGPETAFVDRNRQFFTKAIDPALYMPTAAQPDTLPSTPLPPVVVPPPTDAQVLALLNDIEAKLVEISGKLDQTASKSDIASLRQEVVDAAKSLAKLVPFLGLFGK